MRGITTRQQEVLTALTNYRAEHGYSPSLDDMASILDINRATVDQHLHAMKRKGLVTHKPGASRTWCPVADGANPLLLG